MLISIVIPVYNVEDYILEMLVSLKNQKEKELEFILINDGSTDKSKEIIENFIENDTRFKLFNKINSGVSSARNLGLEYANGDFIGFLDPDDWVNENFYLNVKKHLKDCDILSTGYYKVYKNGKTIEKLPFKSDSKIKKLNFTKNNISSTIIPMLFGYYFSDEVNFESYVFVEGMVWRNLYNARLIKENDIKFDENLSYKEDEIFNLQCHIHAERVTLLNESYYNYRIRDNSLCTGFKKNLLELEKGIYSEKVKLLENDDRTFDYLSSLTSLNNKFSKDMIGMINNFARIDSGLNIVQIKNAIKNIMKDPIVEDIVIKNKAYEKKNLFSYAERVYLLCIKNKRTKTLTLITLCWMLKNRICDIK